MCSCGDRNVPDPLGGAARGPLGAAWGAPESRTLRPFGGPGPSSLRPAGRGRSRRGTSGRGLAGGGPPSGGDLRAQPWPPTAAPRAAPNGATLSDPSVFVPSSIGKDLVAGRGFGRGGSAAAASERGRNGGGTGAVGGGGTRGRRGTKCPLNYFFFERRLALASSVRGGPSPARAGGRAGGRARGGGGGRGRPARPTLGKPPGSDRT